MTPNLKLDIIYRPRKELIPYLRNARTHDETQVKQIAASIQEFGFLNPVIIDGERGVIAGHGRLQAAELMDFDPIPTIEVSHLSETQKRAYVITDNKTALNASWNLELLELELSELQEVEFDVTLTGFTEGEVNYLLDGWDTDHDVTERTQETDETIGVLKVYHDPPDADELKKVILDAVEQAGIANVEVS